MTIPDQYRHLLKYPHSGLWIADIHKKRRGTFKLEFTPIRNLARVFSEDNEYDMGWFDICVKTINKEHVKMGVNAPLHEMIHTERRQIQGTVGMPHWEPYGAYEAVITSVASLRNI